MLSLGPSTEEIEPVTSINVQQCQFFNSWSTHNTFIVPLELLSEDTDRQLVSRTDWEVVVNRTISPSINRATLYYSYKLAVCMDHSDVVGRRYVQRYLRQLSVGMSNTDFDIRRGMVCELLWTAPNLSMATWINFAGAVGNPKCKDWSSYSHITQRQVAYTLESTKHQWDRFPFNVCNSDGELAFLIRRRICKLNEEIFFPSTCAVPMDSPKWCADCETSCKINVVGTSGLIFIVVFSLLGVLLYKTLRCIVVKNNEKQYEQCV